MCQNLLNDPTFIFAIIHFDQKLPLYSDREGGLSTQTQRRSYLSQATQRYSYCCRKCRKRHTPLSIRFLGRRSYIAITLVLACIITQGCTEPRLQKLQSMGIPRQTVHRWLSWWRGKFTLTPVWRELAAHFYSIQSIPLDPIMKLQANRFTEKLILWLKKLTPLTVDESVLERVQINPQSL